MANKNLNYNQKYRDEKLENNSQEERTRARISYFHHINNIFIGAVGGGGRGMVYPGYWDVAALDL